jgi:hypothetical protein
MKDEQCIYVILVKLGSAHSIFVYTFYATKEALGGAYQALTLESFCDSLIRDQDKFLKLGVICYPPCLGVTRGDHISWPTMEDTIPTMMMINMSTNGNPPPPLIHLYSYISTKAHHIQAT